jgi:hypothetical protein
MRENTMFTKATAAQTKTRAKNLIGFLGLGIAVLGAGLTVQHASSLAAQTQNFSVPGLLTFGPSMEQPSNLLALQQHVGGDAIVWLPDGHTLQLKAKSAGPAGDRVSVTSTGSVGIGTTAPRGRLDVKGDLFVDGTIHVSGGTVVVGNCQ